ncbi:hypothetical protein Moror_4776 [Moniliophthora roreri MCA 2997]|uniref:Uncharacterized protein n=2 Tax=Moniliophthora roreri TaxID=221103 RepID=V2XI19_MONRO|nr:hypothetical protein Moror_4776 [Moniliophthora roreri MCA 2997]
MGPEYQSLIRLVGTSEEQERFSGMTYQDMFDIVRKRVEDAEATGLNTLIMDHPHHFIPCTTINHDAKFPRESRAQPTIFLEGISSSPKNPTFLPDAFLFSFTPIFTIRHPARVLQSYIRATYHAKHILERGKVLLSQVEVIARFKWERLVFDAFNQFEGNTRPIVVDGDKLVQDPQSQMRSLCERLGIDTDKIDYVWDPGDLGVVQDAYSDCPEMFKEGFHGTLVRSSGVVSDKNIGPVDIFHEKQRWAEEWDEELASQMEDLESDLKRITSKARATHR